MKVLLVSGNYVKAPYAVYPIGLDYVARAIEDRHQVALLDLNASAALSALATALQENPPDLVGLSIRNIDNTDGLDSRGFTGYYGDIVTLVRAHTSAPIVLGGSGFTIFPEALMDMLKADFGIIGEGERLAGLLAALENGQDPATVPGVILPGQPAHVPPPMGDPIVRKINQAPALTDYYLRHGGMLNLQSKRGCPFRCIYCTYPHIEGHAMRLIDPAEVAATARALQDAGGRYLFITDSAFNAHTDHSLAVAEAFRKADLTIPWGAFFAPTRPPEGYFDRLARAGLTHIEFGTEAMTDSVLAAYRKPFRVADVYLAHGAALAAGVHVAHYMLLGGPGDTPDTLAETLSNIDTLRRSVVFFFCGMRIYPHTALYRLAVEEQLIAPEDDLLEPVFYRSPAMDQEVIQTLVQQHAGGRVNWVLGGGGVETEDVLARLHERGLVGPLWELLVR
ncbi:MAG: lipid biosynthesis B12-binding/radical SAM protein [Desulfobacterales bacterium]|jgi:radical SAM superfamily enzyme YgiQ (UPF0313 family)